MFSTTIQVTFLKAIFLILVAVLCALAVLIVSGEREASQGRRLHYIPRYLSEKEIRGPTYHVHHRMFENKGSESIQRVVHWVNVGNPVTRKVRIVARMGHLIGDEDQPKEMNRKSRVRLISRSLQKVFVK